MPLYDDPLKTLFGNNPAGYGPGNVPATATNPNGYGAFYYDNVAGGGPENLGRINVRTSAANPPADLPSWFPQAQAAKEEEEKGPPPPNYSEALTRAAGPGMFARFTKAPIKPSTPVSWRTFAERGDEPDPASPAAAALVTPDQVKQGPADIGRNVRGVMQTMRNEREARVAPLKKVTFNDLRAQQGAMFGQGPIVGPAAQAANAIGSMLGGAPAAAPPPKMTDAEVRALGMQASQMRADQSAMYGAPSPPSPQASALLRAQNAMYSTPILGRR